jgi:hypothetical protein
VVAACWLHASTASAQLAEDGKAAAVARRVMVSLGQPKDSLAAQAPGMAPTQAPPGTGAGAAIVGTVIALLVVKGINDARERPAQELAAGIDRALAGVDLQGELVRAIGKELERAGHLAGAALEDVREAMDMEQPGLLVRITEREIYTVDSRCFFAPDYLSVRISTTVRLWLKDAFQPAYSAKLDYVSKSLADATEPRAQWIAGDGRALLLALREGVEETARLFVADTEKRAALAKPGAEGTAPAQ